MLLLQTKIAPSQVRSGSGSGSNFGLGCVRFWICMVMGRSEESLRHCTDNDHG